ncbi:MAG: hydroxymethylbilane synthase [Thaumarchaeota archaeon]|nr:hydroxymethylbilane synthase [Nitrososphaerota archaeon]
MENTHRVITIGTRGSPLALAQTQIVIDLLKAKSGTGDSGIQIRRIKTEGDKLSQGSQGFFAGKGSFTKSIDRALAEGEIDLAVHSLKDVPIVDFSSNVIEIAAIPKRESPYDVLVAKNGKETLRSLPRKAKIGTSSVRRALQLRSFRPDLQIVDVHGNVQTRLEKLRDSDLDAIVLAKAGLNRLGLKGGRILPKSIMLPAAGQGALAVAVRKKDSFTKSFVSKIDHEQTRQAVTAEIAFTREMGGDCNLPVAALATIRRSKPRKLILEGMVKRSDSRDTNGVARSRIMGPPKDAESLGEKLALRLKKICRK